MKTDICKFFFAVGFTTTALYRLCRQTDRTRRIVRPDGYGGRPLAGG